MNKKSTLKKVVKGNNNNVLVWIYARANTSSNFCMKIHSQIELCRKFIERSFGNTTTDFEIYSEVNDGRKTGFMDMLNTLIKKQSKKNKVIIIAEVSRITRKIYQLVEILQKADHNGIKIFDASCSKEITKADQMNIVALCLQSEFVRICSKKRRSGVVTHA